MNTIVYLSNDVMENIKLFLTYQEKSRLYQTCKRFYEIKDLFKNYILRAIDDRIVHRTHSYTYQFCYNPFNPYRTNRNDIPYTFLNHSYVNVIMYDTPYSYYNIRFFKPYEPLKTLYQYLCEFDPKNDQVNKITKYHNRKNVCD